MSLHTEDYQAVNADHEEYYGDTVTYSDPKVLPRQVQARIHKEKIARKKYRDGRIDSVITRMIYVNVGDGDDQIADPRIDALIEIGSRAYSVDEIADLTADRVGLSLIRSESREIAKRGHRASR